MNNIIKLLFCGLALACSNSYGQVSPNNSGSASPAAAAIDTIGIYMAIPDTTIITSVVNGKPVFSNSAINNIINHYTVTNFHQAFPKARHLYLKQVYQLNCNSTELGDGLTNSFPLLFPYYEQVPHYTLLSDYYPNEWNSGVCYIKYLQYIGAPTAWGITHGDANTVIGISDTYIDLNNLDLSTKVANLRGTNLPGSEPYHGTMTSGLIAGATDNGYAYPSIGFDCKLDFSSNWGNDDEMLDISTDGRKILNGSWGSDGTTTLNLGTYSQGIYNEIYENGTLAVFSAGNAAGDPYNYFYPASLNHVFSVTNVGWEHDYGSDDFNVVNVHEIYLGDDTGYCYHHNNRIDLCAPAIRIGGLTVDPNDPNKHYMSDEGWGTSFASPLVAGTAGLILSENPCLTPYQVEYILKKSANQLIYDIAENQKYDNGSNRYNGDLGAGALRAGVALQMVDPENHDQNIEHVTCNDVVTQTFTIEGIEINTICKPGSASNGVKPKLVPILKNGTPPYTYHWHEIAGNSTTLDNYDIAEPTIISSTAANVAYYELTVYDNSEIQKVADKTIRVQLSSSATYDLAMRDHYMDMMDEPNSMTTLDPRVWDLWNSPDVWNRTHEDGITTHENPEYFTSAPNFAYVRVRNIGCAASPADAHVKLYWTKASTGEAWPSAWDGSTQVQGAGGLVPAGQEITSGSGIDIPVLQPGETAVLDHSWNPVNPHAYYGSPNEVDVCLLARIETSASAPYGMTILELGGHTISMNVRNNNNIVTRNMLLTDFLPGNSTMIHWVDVANATAVNGNFRIALINDRSINPQMSGDFSAVAYVKLYLGDLFDRWTRDDDDNSHMTINPDERSVTFDGSDSLVLNNIRLNPNERFPVKFEFHLRDGAELNDNQFLLHLIQTDLDSPKDVYGAVNFLITTHADRNKPTGLEDIANAPKGDLDIYPNPANDKLNIRLLHHRTALAHIDIYDIYGRTMLSLPEQNLGGSALDVDISALTPGVYFVRVTDDKGLNEKRKFVKK